jgi:hypothetical protein
MIKKKQNESHLHIFMDFTFELHGPEHKFGLLN